MPTIGDIIAVIGKSMPGWSKAIANEELRSIRQEELELREREVNIAEDSFSLREKEFAVDAEYKRKYGSYMSEMAESSLNARINVKDATTAYKNALEMLTKANSPDKIAGAYRKVEVAESLLQVAMGDSKFSLLDASVQRDARMYQVMSPLIGVLAGLTGEGREKMSGLLKKEVKDWPEVFSVLFANFKDSPKGRSSLNDLNAHLTKNLSDIIKQRFINYDQETMSAEVYWQNAISGNVVIPDDYIEKNRKGEIEPTAKNKVDVEAYRKDIYLFQRENDFKLLAELQIKNYMSIFPNSMDGTGFDLYKFGMRPQRFSDLNPVERPPGQRPDLRPFGIEGGREPTQIGTIRNQPVSRGAVRGF